MNESTTKARLVFKLNFQNGIFRNTDGCKLGGICSDSHKYNVLLIYIKFMYYCYLQLTVGIRSYVATPINFS